jgi:collagenase-like PrtC family protease
MSAHPHRRPEILAPAGSPEALAAALAHGADAVYFGLQDGFNARARAVNFTLDGLDEIVARIHRVGARAYLTLNTLVFEDGSLRSVLHSPPTRTPPRPAPPSPDFDVAVRVGG